MSKEIFKKEYEQHLNARLLARATTKRDIQEAESGVRENVAVTDKKVAEATRETAKNVRGMTSDDKTSDLTDLKTDRDIHKERHGIEEDEIEHRQRVAEKNKAALNAEIFYAASQKSEQILMDQELESIITKKLTGHVTREEAENAVRAMKGKTNEAKILEARSIMASKRKMKNLSSSLDEDDKADKQKKDDEYWERQNKIWADATEPFSHFKEGAQALQGIHSLDAPAAETTSGKGKRTRRNRKNAKKEPADSTEQSETTTETTTGKAKKAAPKKGKGAKESDYEYEDEDAGTPKQVVQEKKSVLSAFDKVNLLGKVAEAAVDVGQGAVKLVPYAGRALSAAADWAANLWHNTSKPMIERTGLLGQEAKQARITQDAEDKNAEVQKETQRKADQAAEAAFEESMANDITFD
jgi:hypothetical protein